MTTRSLHLLTGQDGQIIDADVGLDVRPGDRCRDVVAAVDAAARPVCTDDCVLHLQGPGEQGPVRSRAGVVRLRCTPVGSHRVIRLDRLEDSALTIRPLSPREQEVLGLVARGYTNARIARVLERSPSTVRAHLENILDKLGARSRAEALARAQRLGMLDG